MSEKILRISKEALNKIINGEVKKKVTCVIKFYTNTCPFCESLHDYYVDIAEDDNFSDVRFFAFNMEDDPDLERRLKFNGVPTISCIKANPGKKSNVRILQDPDPPNEKTWYFSNDIKKFIESNK